MAKVGENLRLPVYFTIYFYLFKGKLAILAALPSPSRQTFPSLCPGYYNSLILNRNHPAKPVFLPAFPDVGQPFSDGRGCFPLVHIEIHDEIFIA
jgi:hypothetical protein